MKKLSEQTLAELKANKQRCVNWLNWSESLVSKPGGWIVWNGDAEDDAKTALKAMNEEIAKREKNNQRTKYLLIYQGKQHNRMKMEKTTRTLKVQMVKYDKNSTLNLSRKDGSLVYHPNITSEWTCFEQDHWQPQRLCFIDESPKVAQGDLCMVEWGSMYDGQPLFEIDVLDKIGVGGIHYFNALSMCFGEHEVKAKKIVAVNKVSSEFGRYNKISKLDYIPEEFVIDYVEKYKNDEIITSVNVDLYYIQRPKHFSEAYEEYFINTDGQGNVVVSSAYSRDKENIQS